MHGMLLAESAVLLCFHTVRMSFLVLSHVVIALFAFCTCQCNLCAHDFHLHLYYRSSHLPLRYLILSIKKRPKLFHSPVYYTIEISIRQGIFVDLWGLAKCAGRGGTGQPADRRILVPPASLDILPRSPLYLETIIVHVR